MLKNLRCALKVLPIVLTTIFISAKAITAQEAARNILVFGDSITAGYGIEPQQAFPNLIQQKIDSLGLNYTMINAGLSGETSAGGLRRIDWVLQRPADIVILELGANDALRGVNLADTKQNLQQIIDKIEKKYPDAVILIAGMQMPPNLGEEYTRSFAQIFTDLARENSLPIIPFLLEGVGGVKSLNQEDGIHPNVQGHKIVAENVWKALQPLLN